MRILPVRTLMIYMDSKLYPWWNLLLEKLKQVSFWTTLFRTKNFWVKTMAAFAKSIWVSVKRSEKLSPSFFTNARPRKKNKRTTRPIKKLQRKRNIFRSFLLITIQPETRRHFFRHRCSKISIPTKEEAADSHHPFTIIHQEDYTTTI